MRKQDAQVLAINIISQAKSYFKSLKNFGAYTTMCKNEKSKTLKEQIQWLKDYSVRKGFDLNLIMASK